MQNLREFYLGEGKLLKEDVMKLMGSFLKMMRGMPNVAVLQEPIFVVGDIHGQYYDLVHMFEKAIDG